MRKYHEQCKCKTEQHVPAGREIEDYHKKSRRQPFSVSWEQCRFSHVFQPQNLHSQPFYAEGKSPMRRNAPFEEIREPFYRLGVHTLYLRLLDYLVIAMLPLSA